MRLRAKGRANTGKCLPWLCESLGVSGLGVRASSEGQGKYKNVPAVVL
jgi:hypothetical protein